jgi:translin
MSRLTENLETITEDIREVFKRQDAAREKVLPLSREAVHYCSISIRALHRHEREKAVELLKTAAGSLAKAKQATAGFEELAKAGYIKDAEKEYAEASTLLAMVDGKPLPSHTDLDIAPSAYLNGLGETVGELRRYLLDGMRTGDLSRSEELLSTMDDIYGVLVTMDFPDAITGGLRRTTDNVRGILEKTRSDLTLVIQQKNLEKRLDDFKAGTD